MTLQQATEAMARRTPITYQNRTCYTITGIVKHFSTKDNKFYYRVELTEHIPGRNDTLIKARLEDIPIGNYFKPHSEHRK